MVRSSSKAKTTHEHGWSLWRCQVDGGCCAVVACVEGSTLWQPLAEFPATECLLSDVERLVKPLNERQEDKALQQSAVEVFEAIEDEGYNFATEGALEDLIERLEACDAKSACSVPSGQTATGRPT